jgi:hypothetical protein
VELTLKTFSPTIFRRFSTGGLAGKSVHHFSCQRTAYLAVPISSDRDRGAKHFITNTYLQVNSVKAEAKDGHVYGAGPSPPPPDVSDLGPCLEVSKIVNPDKRISSH